MINSLKSSPFGMLAAWRAATKKKLINEKKVNRRFIDYGCWCFQTEELDNLRLPTVDHFDSACEELTKCETCVKMDHEGDEKCEVDTAYPDYNATITKEGDITCNDPSNSCKNAYCECHKQFAKRFSTQKKLQGKREYTSSRFTRKPKGRNMEDAPTKKEAFCVAPKKGGNDFGQAGRSDFGSFKGIDYDYGVESQSSGGKKVKAKPDTCCGQYPARFPYSSFDGAHGCCGGSTYDKQVKSCCGNQFAGAIFNPTFNECCNKKTGETKSFGTCP